ncbi:MAG: hypothetical protein HY331_07680 [Chloroflexi bacterium]|nr:hypothetical protein [Chloroflexota bacterium]
MEHRTIECPHCRQQFAAAPANPTPGAEKRLVMVGIIRHEGRPGQRERIKEVRLSGLHRAAEPVRNGRRCMV